MQFSKRQLIKMHDALTDWVQNDLGDDICNSPFQRSEYSPFVVIAFVRKIERENIPAYVLAQLQSEINAAPVVVYKPSFLDRLKVLFRRTAK